MKTSSGRIALVAFCFLSVVLCGRVLAQQVYFGAGNATRTFASPLANRSLARIRVNILSPGLCETEIWKDIVAAAPSEKECIDYWSANIPGQRAWRAADGSVRDFQFAEPVCAVAPIAEGRLLVAFAKRLAYVNPADLSCEEICHVEPNLPGNRCNDGKMDPAGRFWIGTMSLGGKVKGAGALYRLDEGGRLTRVLDQLTITNGMGWSRDSQTMYFIDSPTREIWAFEFDSSDSSK
jgi:sugar lactone lactonase YvrE